MLRTAIAGLGAALLSVSAAAASPFDDMTAEEIFAHPEFHASEYSLSSATNDGDPDVARNVYHWVGYIPWEGKRVYFTSFGEPLTCVQWERNGEWVPEWVADALENLTEEGYISLDGEGMADDLSGGTSPSPGE